MNTMPAFHGSDLEKIAEYYHIPQDSIINFGANVNPLGISNSVKEKIKDNIDLLSSYPDRAYTSLRETIGAYCHVSPDTVVIGNGSTELIALLIEQVAPQKALLLGPTYSEYSRELGFVCGTWDYFNLNENEDFNLNTKELIDALTPDINMLIICNPNNPTSSAIKQIEMRKILSTCNQKNIFVMIDETYVEFSPDIDEITAVPLVSEFSNVMILRGVSKFFAAPGMRLGYGITSNRAFLERLKIHQNPWTLNSIGAFAGEAMLKDSDYITKTHTLICKERTRLLAALKNSVNYEAYPAYANFILLKIKKPGVTSQQVFEHCIQHSLMIRDCSTFEALGGEYIRFCIMTPEANTRLLECLESI